MNLKLRNNKVCLPRASELFNARMLCLHRHQALSVEVLVLCASSVPPVLWHCANYVVHVVQHKTARLVRQSATMAPSLFFRHWICLTIFS